MWGKKTKYDDKEMWLRIDVTEQSSCESLKFSKINCKQWKFLQNLKIWQQVHGKIIYDKFEM